MKILKAEIRWWEGYGNLPDLIVTVDRVPRLDELRFEVREVPERPAARAYFASTEDGYAYHVLHDPENETGFGGAIFDLTMKDGSRTRIRGPWSSRPAVMESLGFPAALEVGYRSTGYNLAAALLLPQAREALKSIHPDLQLTEEWDERFGEWNRFIPKSEKARLGL